MLTKLDPDSQFPSEHFAEHMNEFKRIPSSDFESDFCENAMETRQPEEGLGVELLRFKESLMVGGFAKIICLTNDRVEIAWNAYDRATGEPSKTHTRVLIHDHTSTRIE
jgi:hypothetical protein